jgi:hypothetical protein
VALSDIYLGPHGSMVLLTPFGRTMKTVDVYPSIREGRTASGRLVRDFGGIKKKQFLIEYSEIDAGNLTAILDIEDSMTEIYVQIACTEALYNEYLVLMKPIERQLLVWYPSGIWRGVSLTLDQV